jgi:tetratricopeptide (TPR) repeat protein
MTVVVVPRQLPSDVPGFAARWDELRWLDVRLRAADDSAAPPGGFVVVDGPAGVGKTALVVHWAHRVCDRFPDGQLYLDLRGHFAGPALTPIEAVGRLLRSLGMSGEETPSELDVASGLYRSLVADRRMLVVLDNAGSADQVRPLLPGGAGCAVVVTSRHRLDGLVARDGATRLGVSVLSTIESRTLLSGMLGAERVDAELKQADELARLCGHLPLALRVAAANLALRPRKRIASQVEHLRTGDRLAALAAAGDPHGAVAAAFGLSYQRLSKDERHMFRLLGLVPGPDVTVEAAGALTGTAPEHAAHTLESLAQANLVEEYTSGRYRCHDLLSAYATDRSEAEESDAARVAARARLFWWYLGTAAAAASVLYPQGVLLPACQTTTAVPAISPIAIIESSEAIAWLDAEHANLVAAVAHAAAHGPRPIAWLLADKLRGRLWRKGDPASWLAISTAALDAARKESDPQAEATALLSLGDLQLRHGQCQEALDRYGSALACAKDAGWPEGQALVLNNTARAELYMGRLADAAVSLADALELNRSLGRRAHWGVNLTNLGTVFHEMGELDKAARYHDQALLVHRRCSAVKNEAKTLRARGEVLRDLGLLGQAIDTLTRALELSRTLDYRSGKAYAECGLASVHHEAGRYASARELAGPAIRLAGETADRRLEARARNIAGAAHLHLGQPRVAVTYHFRALDLARAGGDRGNEIDALLGLALAHLHVRLHSDALKHANTALRLAHDHSYRLREGRALTVLARAHLLRDDVHSASEFAQQALTLQRTTGHSLDEARTRLVLSNVRRRTDRTDAAEREWRRASTLFRNCGVNLPDLAESDIGNKGSSDGQARQVESAAIDGN